MNPEQDTVVSERQQLPDPAQAPDATRAELSLEVGMASDVGPWRQVNEDCADYRVPEDQALYQAKGALFVVADGMGGHQAGDVASSQAVGLIIEGYYGDDTAEPDEGLLRAIEAANNGIYEEALSDPSKSGMGTTVVAAIVLGDKVIVANVGDSRAYLVTEQEIIQITEDHSWVEEQVRAGLMSREQADHHPQRNLITRALGSRASVNIDLFEGELREGESLLLCTDGLSNPLSDLSMAETIRTRPPSEAALQLVEQAAKLGGDDNATALVIKAVHPGQDVAEDHAETVVDKVPSEEIIVEVQPEQRMPLPQSALRSRRSQVVVTVALLVVAFWGAATLLGGTGRLSGRRPAVAPRLGPITNQWLAASSLDQVAAYLGYAGVDELRAAHDGYLDAFGLGSAELWPSEPAVLLVGQARGDECAGRVCTLQIETGDQTFRVSYQPVPDDQPLAGKHIVRILGRAQGGCTGESGCTTLIAESIERQRSWLTWWGSDWETVFRATAAAGPTWIYGVIGKGGSGLMAADDRLGLQTGDPVLVCGRWQSGDQAAIVDRVATYVWAQGRYVPVSGQGSRAPLPAMTLEPAATAAP